MSISDIITLLTLVIAIVAILSEKNRTFVLLKFSRLDYGLFISAFLLINYFVFYKSFYSRKWYWSALYFPQAGLKEPRNWAYVITIGTLVYILYKIYFSFFPRAQRSAVVNYYNRQIENGEYVFVVDLLTRYHQQDISRYLTDGPPYDPKADRHHRFTESRALKARWKSWRKRHWSALFPSSWSNRQLYARTVLNNVIATPAFLTLVSPIRPYFFAGFFDQFKEKNRDRFSREMIDPYLEQLLTHRSFWLAKELKESTENAPTQPEWFFDNNRILAALWTDLSVSHINEVWRPFGEVATTELKIERAKGRASDLFNKSRGDENRWKYTTFWSIQFFYAMINQAIVTTYKGSSLSLIHYAYILEEIIETLDSHALPGSREGADIIYDELADEIETNVFSWLDQSNKHEHPELWFNILDCIGLCVYHVCSSTRIGEKRILQWLNSLFFYYCHLEQNELTDALRTKYEEIIKKPTLLAEAAHPYYAYLIKAWAEFDKIPHRSPGGSLQECAYFTRLKQRVIIPLGMNPNAY